jgi:tetratricopeptide (TPR) repeat protein
MNDGTLQQKLRARTVSSVWGQCPGEKHTLTARAITPSDPYFLLGSFALLSLAFVPPSAQGSLPPQASDQKAKVQAEEALKGRDYSRAIALYRQILRDQPDNASALLNLARAYLLFREFTAAADTYQLVLRRDQYNQDALIGIGEAYNLLGNYATAERPLKQALRVAPDNANAVWALSRTYFYERRLGNAERLLKPAVAAHPRDFRLWESLGEVQSGQGRTVGARQSLQRALELNPKARRAQILLQTLEARKATETGLKVEFRDSAYLLNDGVGNQILTFPQTLTFGYGTRWQNHLTGEYRRVAFRSGVRSGAASPEGVVREEGSLAVGIASATDSTEFRVNNALTLTGGGGAAHYLEEGSTRPVYHAGLKFNPVPGLQLSYSYGQRIVAPTELAARLGLTQRGWSSHLGYSLPKATSLDLTYYQDHLSDFNRLRGGHGEIRHVLWQGPFQVSAGYQLESLSFARLDLFHGYFSPKRFLANTALINLEGRRGRLHYDYDFDIGEETYTRPVLISTVPLAFVAQRRSSARFISTLRNSYQLNSRWSFQFSFVLYRSALSSSTGAYQAYAFLFGLSRRF